MSDLDACNGENCPLRETCRRHVRFATHAQDWQCWIAGDYHDGECSMYEHDEPGEKCQTTDKN